MSALAVTAAASAGGECGEAASLSLLSQLREARDPGEAVGTPDLPFKLTGSQERTKRAIEINVERMVGDAGSELVGMNTTWAERLEAGIERMGFLTLTVGDWKLCAQAGCDGCKKRRHFVQIYDGEEANRRVNKIARRFLPSLFVKWAIVTERHQSGAIHFHLAVQSRVNIRGSFDWRAVRGNKDEGIFPDYSSALPALRALWSLLRQELPNFGFGRAQLEPAKGAECLARYVAKYVEKNLFNRLPEDRGKKLVRYGGFQRTHCRSNDVGWASEGAMRWRVAVQCFAITGGKTTSREQVRKELGPKWAYRISECLPTWDFFDHDFTVELWRRMKARHRAEDGTPIEELDAMAEWQAAAPPESRAEVAQGVGRNAVRYELWEEAA